MKNEIESDSHQNEGHGDHWSAVLPNRDLNGIEDLLRVVCEEGRPGGEAGIDVPLDDGRTRPEKVLAFTYPDTPLRYLLLAVSDSSRGEQQNSMVSAYPYMDGLVNRIRVDAITPWANGIEGVVHGTITGGAAISFFDADFYKNRSVYQPGMAYDFSVAALAYRLAKAKEDTVTITEGPMIKLEQERALAKDPNTDISKITSVELSLADLRCLMCSDRIPDDAEFRTVVEEAGYFEVRETGFYRIRAVLTCPEDQNFEGYIYAAEGILNGYRPKTGDSVEGWVWLQGRLVSDTPHFFEE